MANQVIHNLFSRSKEWLRGWPRHKMKNHKPVTNLWRFLERKMGLGNDKYQIRYFSIIFNYVHANVDIYEGI